MVFVNSDLFKEVDAWKNDNPYLNSGIGFLYC